MHVNPILIIYYLAPQETASLTTVFKKSYEYEEIQNDLEPLLDKALNESRGISPKYNTYFPWQVIVLANNFVFMHNRIIREVSVKSTDHLLSTN